jgi:hypothetical protein
VAELLAFIRRFGITDIVSWGIPPGIHPDEMSAPLELLVSAVIPKVRRALGQENPGQVK